MEGKVYNLEERTLLFSKDVLSLLSEIKMNQANQNIVAQCIRSCTSIGANYREANDALGKKDFVMRIRIARKEAKESAYWLELLEQLDIDRSNRLFILKKECQELVKILSSILIKSL